MSNALVDYELAILRSHTDGPAPISQGGAAFNAANEFLISSGYLNGSGITQKGKDYLDAQHSLHGEETQSGVSNHGGGAMIYDQIAAGFAIGRQLTQEEWAEKSTIIFVDQMIAEGKAVVIADWEWKDNFQCERRLVKGVVQDA